MGVFRWSKDRKNAKKVIQKSAQKAILNEAQNTAQKNEEEAKRRGPKRCTLLVEDFFESSRIQGVMVIGNLHGRVREGDTLYMYQQGKPVKEVHVIGIELGPRDVVETARDQQVGLGFDLESIDEVSRYTVFSSVKPVEGEMAIRIIENPRLFGLMMEYERLYQNSAYMDALLYELCYAKFLIPLYMERPPIPQADGSMTFGKETFVGFHSLKKADDESQVVFPAFTDEVATMTWKEAFQEGQPKRFATMQLPHLMMEVRKGHAGIVINPFGPVPVYFSKELLDQVEQSEVFIGRYVKPDMTKKENGTTEA